MVVVPQGEQPVSLQFLVWYSHGPAELIASGDCILVCIFAALVVLESGLVNGAVK